MKTLYVFLFVAFAPFAANAQCFVQVTTNNCSCYGICDGSASAFAGGGTGPYTYVWAPGGQTTQTIGGLCPGTYTVLVTDAGGCNTTGIATITQPSQINPNTTSVAASCSSCCDGTISTAATGGTPAYTYNWYPSGGPGASTSGLGPGTYVVCVVDVNGCMVCDTVALSFTTGTDEMNAAGTFEVFPNPASEKLVVTQTFSVPSTATITLTNVLGETVYTRRTDPATQLNESIRLDSYTPGVYFVTVETSESRSVKKIVVE